MVAMRREEAKWMGREGGGMARRGGARTKKQDDKDGGRESRTRAGAWDEGRGQERGEGLSLDVARRNSQGRALALTVVVVHRTGARPEKISSTCGGCVPLGPRRARARVCARGGGFRVARLCRHLRGGCHARVRA